MKNTNVWSFAQAKKRSLFAIALIVTAIIQVYAQQYDPESDFQIDWDKNVKGGVIITEYIGTKTEISIPPTIQNNPVTGIEYSAFERARNRDRITSITIPNGVKSIGYGAFEDCIRLTSVNIPDGVTSIGGEVFHNCESLTSIIIPNSVTQIGSSAFAGCKKLTSVTLPNKLTVIENSTFSGCESLTSVTIPNSVTKIGGAAFSSSRNGGLTSVTIPAALKRLGITLLIAKTLPV